jgi:tryptophan synthase alpha chain
MPDLESALLARRERGGRSFVPYVTGGMPGVDAALLRDLADAGADAIEVGLPFSDPIMDGGVIQEASRLALEHGARTSDVLAVVEEAALDVPVAVMTYYNPVLRRGVAAFLSEAAACGVAGAIVPDLPVDGRTSWSACAGRPAWPPSCSRRPAPPPNGCGRSPPPRAASCTAWRRTA